jgi:cytochrome b6-f complex iron-sulfur subunit
VHLRRKILRWIVSIPVALVLKFRDSAAAGKRAISLDRVEKLKTTGGSVLLKVEGLPVLFVRESEETIRGVDPTCTHKKCTVEYNKSRNRFICPCHGSQYDLEGRVLKGPAEKPLKNLDAYLESGRIIFTLGEPND